MLSLGIAGRKVRRPQALDAPALAFQDGGAEQVPFDGVLGLGETDAVAEDAHADGRRAGSGAPGPDRRKSRRWPPMDRAADAVFLGQAPGQGRR